MKNSTLMVLLSSLSMSVVACAQVEDTPTVDPDSALVVQEPPNDYSGFVILRLSPDLAEPSAGISTLSEVAREMGLRGLDSTLVAFDIPPPRRVVQSMAPTELLEMESDAATSDLPPLHSLTLYWRLDTRNHADQVEEIVRQLNTKDKVDMAYREFSATAPSVAATSKSYTTQQGTSMAMGQE